MVAAGLLQVERGDRPCQSRSCCSWSCRPPARSATARFRPNVLQHTLPAVGGARNRLGSGRAESRRGTRGGVKPLPRARRMVHKVSGVGEVMLSGSRRWPRGDRPVGAEIGCPSLLLEQVDSSVGSSPAGDGLGSSAEEVWEVEASCRRRAPPTKRILGHRQRQALFPRGAACPGSSATIRHRSARCRDRRCQPTAPAACAPAPRGRHRRSR